MKASYRNRTHFLTRSLLTVNGTIDSSGAYLSSLVSCTKILISMVHMNYVSNTGNYQNIVIIKVECYTRESMLYSRLKKQGLRYKNMMTSIYRSVTNYVLKIFPKYTTYLFLRKELINFQKL